MLECVQEDRNNPLPCSHEDRAKWGAGSTIGPGPAPGGTGTAPTPPAGGGTEDDLMRQMMGGKDGG